MKVGIASDHGGFRLKEALKRRLFEMGHEVVDFGCSNETSCDYPDFAMIGARALSSGEVDRCVLVCGTGIGMSMAANRIKGVRAALCNDSYSAEMARRHNDANCLALGQRVIGEGLAMRILEIFLTTPFDGGRHQIRVSKIMALDEK